MKLNTHIHKTAVTAICALALSPALVFAAGTQKPIRERGIIKSVDINAHTLVVTGHKTNAEQKFQWNDQTKFSERNKFFEPNKQTSASALEEGERVHFKFTPGGDTPVLQSMNIAPARMAKSASANP